MVKVSTQRVLYRFFRLVSTRFGHQSRLTFFVFSTTGTTCLRRGDGISASAVGTHRGGGGWGVFHECGSATSERLVLLASFALMRYCSGVWGWKTHSGVRGWPRGFDLGSSLRGCGGGKPPRGWGCGWGCSWPPDFGRGARPRAGCVVAPRPKAGGDGGHAGGKPRVLARTTKTFFCGAITEARGTERRRRWRAPATARSFATSRARAAGAGAEWNAPECPAKKRTWFSPCPGRCERSECRCVTTVLDGGVLLCGPFIPGSEWMRECDRTSTLRNRQEGSCPRR